MAKEINILNINSAAQWRAWLEANHNSSQVVWLVLARKHAGKTAFRYEEALDEALCYGWIDSTKRANDEHSSLQSFTQRKSKSVWSGINKNKVKRLIKEGRMAKPGLESIKAAKANGYWTILDNVEKLIIPDDLQLAFRKNPGTEKYFLTLSPSNRKLVLRWLVLAQRPETRMQRIESVIAHAKEEKMPKQLI